MTNSNELRDRWQAHLRLAEEERTQRTRVRYGNVNVQVELRVSSMAMISFTGLIAA